MKKIHNKIKLISIEIEEPSLGFYIGKGWYPLLEDLILKLQSEGWEGKFTQIKEKFGALRIYGTEFTDQHNEAVTKIEEMSHSICEHCGNIGRPTGKFWIKTFCEPCEKINEQERAKIK